MQTHSITLSQEEKQNVKKIRYRRWDMDLLRYTWDETVKRTIEHQIFRARWNSNKRLRSTKSQCWDSEEVIQIHFMLKGATKKNCQHQNMLMKLWSINNEQNTRKTTSRSTTFVLQYHTQTIYDTIALSEKFKCTLLPHLPYSLYLAPSDYHVFLNMKT